MLIKRDVRHVLDIRYTHEKGVVMYLMSFEHSPHTHKFTRLKTNTNLENINTNLAIEFTFLRLPVLYIDLIKIVEKHTLMKSKLDLQKLDWLLISLQVAEIYFHLSFSSRSCS